MGRHERESLASEAQRLALIGEIREKLLLAFSNELSPEPSNLRLIARIIDSVLNDYR